MWAGNKKGLLVTKLIAHANQIEMPKLQQKKHKNNNLIRLPRLFSAIFTNPKYTSTALDVLILLAQNGAHNNLLHLPKTIRPSYIKTVVVPFLATLQIDDTPLFTSIAYNTGRASISYQFSHIILEEFAKIEPAEDKKDKKSTGYIMVNVAEFLSLKGLYTKQLYLSLCSRQKGQSLDLYRGGRASIFATWQLPKSYRNGLLSQVLKPAITKINASTSLHVVKVSCYNDKFKLVYKRLKKADKKRAELAIEIDRYPHVPLKILNYGSSLFTERKPWQHKKAEKKPPKPQPNYTPEAYYARLVEAGFDEHKAKDYTIKKYRLTGRYFASGA